MGGGEPAKRNAQRMLHPRLQTLSCRPSLRQKTRVFNERAHALTLLFPCGARPVTLLFPDPLMSFVASPVALSHCRRLESKMFMGMHRHDGLSYMWWFTVSWFIRNDSLVKIEPLDQNVIIDNRLLWAEVSMFDFKNVISEHINTKVLLP